MKLPKYYTIWKVVDAEENICFEGKFTAAENYIKEQTSEDVKLVAFMYEHEPEQPPEIEEPKQNEEG